MKNRSFKAMLDPVTAGARAMRTTAAVTLLLLPGLTLAGGLTNGQVVSGNVTIAPSQGQTGITTTITQTSNLAAVNWDTFNVPTGDTVNFVQLNGLNQPDATAIILNRVVGTQGASEIHGMINANGRVFIINPQGVMFGQGAQVDVGGLVASTLSISDADFAARRFVFQDTEGASVGDVINNGLIDASDTNGDHGFIVLAGANSVVNNGGGGTRGLIAGRFGHILMASGKKLTLDLSGNGLVNFVVDEATTLSGAKVINAGDVLAHSGRVVMTLRTASQLASAVVNNSGRLSATGIESDGGGQIFLTAQGPLASVSNSGSLDATAENQIHGNIEIKADGAVSLVTGSSVAGHNLTVTGKSVSIGSVDIGLLGVFKATSQAGDLVVNGYGAYGGYGGYGGYGSTSFIAAQAVDFSATGGDVVLTNATMTYTSGLFRSTDGDVLVSNSGLQGRASHTFGAGGDIRLSNSYLTGVYDSAPVSDGATATAQAFALGQFSAVMGGDFDLGNSFIQASRVGITGIGPLSAGATDTANAESAVRAAATVADGSDVTLNGTIQTNGLLRVVTTDEIYSAGTSLYVGAMSLTGTKINLFGQVRAGSLPAGAGLDPQLMQLVALATPELLPASLSPNVSLTATGTGIDDGVYVENLSMEGDYLHVQAPRFEIGNLSFDSNLFVNFASTKAVIDTEGDIDFGNISNSLPGSMDSAPIAKVAVDNDSVGLTVALGSSTYAGDIVFGSNLDAGGGNILYLTTGQVSGFGGISNAGRVVDLGLFRGLLTRGEVAANTQLTAQLQDSTPTEEKKKETAGTTDAGDGATTDNTIVENKSTKDEQEGELTCS